MQEQMALYIDHIEWGRRTQPSQGSYKRIDWVFVSSLGMLGRKSGKRNGKIERGKGRRE
jgi:hypothetical protein